jgi:3-vinyl bacteriochlorophyllide hydratase
MEYRQSPHLKAVFDLHRPAFAARSAPVSSSDSSAENLSRSPDKAVDNFFGRRGGRVALYSVDERRRRDQTPWTLVQGVLAPIQFLIFLISLGLVVRSLATGEGVWIANASVVIKTLALYTIMITGSIWEKVVFGRYLFAPAFFWEDVFSMLVLALHTAYLLALATGALDTRELLLLALAAYLTYVVNATQFLLKLRAARLDARDEANNSDLTSERLGSVA